MKLDDIDNTSIENKRKEKLINELQEEYNNVLTSLRFDDGKRIQEKLHFYQLSYINAVEYLSDKEKLQYSQIVQRIDTILKENPNKAQREEISDFSNEMEKNSKKSLLDDIDCAYLEAKSSIIKRESLSTLVQKIQWYHFTILNAGSSLTKEEYNMYQQQYQSLVDVVNTKYSQKLQKEEKTAYKVNGSRISRVRFPGHEIEETTKNTSKKM